MLSLDSADWSSLKHAYGDASDVPAMLRQLASLPDSFGQSEPWFSIWSALAHQGDVYSGSFAAVPHVIAALATAPNRASFVYFQFPTWVEICRQRHKMEVPEQLRVAYFDAIGTLPNLVCAAAKERDWDADFHRSALSAMAIAKGSALMAEAIMELDEATATELLQTVHG
jgi:hypothetical protein